MKKIETFDVVFFLILLSSFIIFSNHLIKGEKDLVSLRKEVSSLEKREKHNPSLAEEVYLFQNKCKTDEINKKTMSYEEKKECYEIEKMSVYFDKYSIYHFGKGIY